MARLLLASSVLASVSAVPHLDRGAHPLLWARPCALGRDKRCSSLLCAAEAVSALGDAAYAQPRPRPPPPRPTGVSDWGTLLRLCAPDWPLLLLAFASLAAAASGDALLPALQATALNSVLYADSPVPLGHSLARLAVVGVGTALFTGVRGFIFWVTGSRLVARLRATLFEALIKQPQEFHDEQGPGELSTRLASDCVKLGDVLTLNVNIVLRQIIQSVVGLCIVFKVNAKLGALVLGGVVARACISSVYAGISRRLSMEQTNALAASSGVTEQCLSLIKIVRSHGTDEREVARYRGVLGRLLDLQTKQGLLYGGSRVVNGALSSGLLIAVLAMGGSLVSSGLLPRQALTSFVLYVEFIGSASADVADQWSRIQEALGSATTVFALLEPRPMRGATESRAASADQTEAAAQAGGEAAAQGGGAAPVELVGSVAPSQPRRGALHLDGVSFSYPSRPTVTVLDSLHLSIRPGERVAIVGGSGSGKSTIFALALRFYCACGGSLSLDGQPIESIPEQELRRRIAWVPQEPPLFPNATIAENIAYGFEEASPAQIEAAAREAYAHEFIRDLPDGYGTLIGAAGASLSGGQRQRVALARALIRDPSLLLLDEATSALDPESERRVQAAIRRASGSRSVIFTTHKVSQARTADRIIVMSHGRIVELGTHDELLAADGAYAQLLRAGDSVSEAEASNVVDLALRD